MADIILATDPFWVLIMDDLPEVPERRPEILSCMVLVGSVDVVFFIEFIKLFFSF